MSPQRIQRRRSDGWRTPEGAVYVGRPTKWGNPFKVYLCPCCRHWDVIDENGVTYLINHKVARRVTPLSDSKRDAHIKAVSLFKGLYVHMYGSIIPERDLSSLAVLRGKDLVCWCPASLPCHADVLLDLANRPEVLS